MDTEKFIKSLDVIIRDLNTLRTSLTLGTREENLKLIKEIINDNLKNIGYDEDTEINEENKIHRKLFVFKVNGINNVINQDSINERIKEISKQTEESLKDYPATCFNVFKIETIRDPNTFSDLVRGVIYFR